MVFIVFSCRVLKRYLTAVIYVAVNVTVLMLLISECIHSHWCNLSLFILCSSFSDKCAWIAVQCYKVLCYLT